MALAKPGCDASLLRRLTVGARSVPVALHFSSATGITLPGISFPQRDWPRSRLHTAARLALSIAAPGLPELRRRVNRMALNSPIGGW